MYRFAIGVQSSQNHSSPAVNGTSSASVVSETNCYCVYVSIIELL